MHSIYFAIFILGVISIIYHNSDIYNKDKNPRKQYVITNPDGGQIIIEEKQLPPKYIDYVKSAHSGLIRGLILGIILGDYGISSGIRNGAVFSIINPLMIKLGY